MILNYIGSLLAIFSIFLFLRQFILLKELYKIGTLNLTLILTYIIIDIIHFFVVIRYLEIINAVIFLFIIYRLSNLNITFNYKFIKNDRVFHYFNQKDKRWKNVVYGISTIGKSGCGPAILAMIHSAINPNINPEEVGRWINKNYSIELGTPTDVLANYLNNIEVENSYLSRNADISLELKRNTVICVLFKNNFAFINKLIGTSINHLVLLYKINGNNAYIADPQDYIKTRKTIRLDKLLKKVNKLPDNVTHPYILVHF